GGHITPVNISSTSQYFGYNGSGYIIASTLLPGHGYWVKTTTTGANAQLQMTAPAALPKIEQAGAELAEMSQLIVRDVRGGNQTLYLGSESVLQSALNSYEMPPSIAELSGFDARYSSGRMVETYPAVMSNTTKYEYTINIQASAYPVTISLEGTKATLAGVKMAARTQQGQLLGSLSGAGSSVKITSPSVKSVILTLNDGANIPKVFALGQNYPNPFNPTTRFTVDVPNASTVEVTIYDVLGQKVNTIMNGQQAPGSITVQWDGRDASGLPVTSGVYFVHMKADNFTATQKIMLMK
ncbi:MAG TPA: FlgD immunoglobulin-like domain containing protein, partial [Bacteroidota bacterium]|nr:FlgD immunoglobulin-like domain containing protein [Bacteroidota bacterium]